MICKMCGHTMFYKETVTFSTGRVADIYICNDCGFFVRIYH